ncbi:hypothetical protein DXA09_01540 [Absiella sp. AM54-8XD]|nr:hypothetical protein DW271_01135 [Absiella sp. AM22-9]RGB63212.1 hypothetical protein DW120_00175 [Absiella sp. AM10-20]RGB65082.1 hypothetical protein DW113_13020 [Absiella sp. AM09-45]RGB74613.1 hypothetical protein DW114_12910 [Absiella sp. AM09-50]RGC26205.1 hypothetical protein DXA09_01540 [Absiella sp. AM54-8XD]RGC52839.1 hypothetical protein DW761_04115 [Absiella sp. AM29-15]RHU03893.1 hypothetical protein DW716_15135 [Absiella sp. AM27-20]
MLNMYQGMAPIKTNSDTKDELMIKVIDVQGNYLHDTYERRAKGLVKKGRASYINECTICMGSASGKEPYMEQMTKEEMLKEIELMLKNQDYFKMALDTIEKIPTDMDKELVEQRITAVMNIVKEKETTNQKLIDLWTQMYQA